VFSGRSGQRLSKSHEFARHPNKQAMLPGQQVKRRRLMQYMRMDYVQVEGFFKLTQEEQDHWLGAYRAYLEAMRTSRYRTSPG